MYTIGPGRGIITPMDIILLLTEELKIQKWQTEAVIRLIDEGNTIPFIARYRKEATGALNDEVLRTLDERLRYLRNLEERKKNGPGLYRRAGPADRRTEKTNRRRYYRRTGGRSVSSL